MEDYLRACDVLISNPGGLTASESLALGKPMVVLRPVPGMEAHQTARLEQTGAVFAALDPDGAADRVVDSLQDQALRVRIGQGVRQNGHPDSARQVAARLLEAVNRAGGSPGA
ncbi:MAG: glycosyltransferase [Armatimonadetes bacterium]|nr:glycosyltransferase [Armatimonadota bacterium]